MSDALKAAEKAVGAHGRVLLSFLGGSAAYGASTATSDRDYLCVFAAPLRAAVSIGGPRDTLEWAAPHAADGAGADKAGVVEVVAYEAAKYCALLLKGNPKVVEPIFAAVTGDAENFVAPEFAALAERCRGALLTRTTLRQYVGYARVKLHALRGAKTEAEARKAAYHALRLAWEARRIALGAAPVVRLTGAEREKVLDVRAGRLALADAEREAVAVLDEACAAESAPGCTLPDATDPALLGDWLVRAVRGVGSDVQQQQTVGVAQCTNGAEALLERACGLLQARGLGRARVLLLCDSGSTLHGLARHRHDAAAAAAAEEEDVVGVYQQPLAAALSLQPCPDFVVDREGAKGSPELARGLVLYEARFAAAQLEAGNHRLIEALVACSSDSLLRSLLASPAPQGLRVFATTEWMALAREVTKDDTFIGKRLITHYAGLAEGQLKAAESAAGIVAQRKLAHALLLAHAAAGLGMGQRLSLRAAEEGSKAELMLLKLLDGEATEAQFAEGVKQARSEIDAAKKAAPKQRTNVHAALDMWLVETVRLRKQ